MSNLNFDANTFTAALPEIRELAQLFDALESFRNALLELCDAREQAAVPEHEGDNIRKLIRARDCARNLRMLLAPRSEQLSGFSFAQAIYDLCRGQPRPDLSPDFYADAQHIFLGLLGKGSWQSLIDVHLVATELEGREAAIARSSQLDELFAAVEGRMSAYAHGLQPRAIARREKRVAHICQVLGVDRAQFDSWEWQFANVITTPEQVARLTTLNPEEQQAIETARRCNIPFGITPYYLALIDDDPSAGRDRAIRAQVLPPLSYVDGMSGCHQDRSELDFMLEHDTSPIDLITRRYPSICILKPYNTCPQICVYCQRNWEIDQAMDPGALASPQQIEAAIAWIARHPAIQEVLVTGGDPLGMDDATLRSILDGLAAIPSIERIRIGTRTPVTAPMRLNQKLVDLLSSYRVPGQRQIAVVTHVEHPYEITPQMVAAIERLRKAGISIYNQQVYTFFVSRRFETALLRRLLARIGIQPYYTFNTKGKEETDAYRVPLARLLQETKEEARLVPGISRTDEGVYNVPGLGKNYLRAAQHRALIALLPSGKRLYEFHPWEKNITRYTKSYLGDDMPLLSYLRQLKAIGENPADYDTLWYYF